MSPGERLLALCAAATEGLLLCAPFAKTAVLRRLLEITPQGVDIELITRWRPEEIAAGVSDTGVLEAVAERGGRVYLHDRLHAKFYVSSGRVLLGSANLTATALGWATRPNVELLVGGSRSDVAGLEEQLRRESIVATHELALLAETAAASLPRRIAELPGEALGDDSDLPVDLWFPSLRQPTDLYLAYSTGTDRLASASADAARRDLLALDIPAGLERFQFYQIVGHRLVNETVVRDVDEFLRLPRRFGEVREYVASREQLSRLEAEYAWQTLMRWLLEFLPHRYDRRVARWSEVMSRNDG